MILINSNIIFTSFLIFVVLETWIQVFYLVLGKEAIDEALSKSTHFFDILFVEIRPYLHPVEELCYRICTWRYEPYPIYRLAVIKTFSQKVKNKCLIYLLKVLLRLLNLENQAAAVRVGWVFPGRADFSLKKIDGIDSLHFVLDFIAK